MTTLSTRGLPGYQEEVVIFVCSSLPCHFGKWFIRFSVYRWCALPCIDQRFLSVIQSVVWRYRCARSALSSLESAHNLQIYDFFQTLELEVEYIWKSPFTPFKLLYVFMKYLPYVDVSLLIVRGCLPSFCASQSLELLIHIPKVNHATLMPQECRTLNLISGCKLSSGGYMVYFPYVSKGSFVVGVAATQGNAPWPSLPSRQPDDDISKLCWHWEPGRYGVALGGWDSD